MKRTIVILSIFFLAACNNGTEKKSGETETESQGLNSISEQPYGNFEGKPVTQYTLTNANGMVVKIINYGATVTDIIVPDKNGEPGDVVLGYDSLSGYTQPGNPYFGAIVGRYGNRIAKAMFTLDGTTYKLSPNDHGNTLHGGVKGFDKVLWEEAGTEKENNRVTLALQYVSKDGEEGYPGTLTSTVAYTLTNDDELKIQYIANTDKPTPVNLTNHSYFNLSAGKDSTILDHVLMLNADKYTAVDNSLIPTGELPDVKGTPMDFTSPKRIGNDIDKVKGGYDHNWVINRTSDSLEMIGSLYDPSSSRYMEVFTTQPGVQFYTGNFLDGTLRNTRDGMKYVKHGALCLETQHFPDSPNQPSFPSTILKPGETYNQTTIYKFSVK